MTDFKSSKLQNGLEIVSAPLKNSKAMTLLFSVRVGSRYEKKNINGLAHFLEHMFFKGTKKRPTTLDISKALDSVGANYNAFTSEESTGFYVRAASEHFDLALDILFDMLFDSKFEEQEIDREKGVIIEEINMYQDNPQLYIYEVLKELFYGDQPLGWQISGTKDVIRNLSQKDFIDFKNSHYHPKNMVITVAGGIQASGWINEISRKFSQTKGEKIIEYQKVKEDQSAPGLKIYHKKTDQAHLALGFRTIARNHPKRPILRVLCNLLGENMSSRLFTEVRERRGLAYYVSSEMSDFQDTGALVAVAGTNIERTEEASKVLLEEFKKLSISKVSDEELKRAKENLKGRLYIGLEDSANLAEFLAEQQLYLGKIETPEELIKKYEKVTAEDVQNFAREYFVAKNLNLAVIGPFENEEIFKKTINNY